MGIIIKKINQSKVDKSKLYENIENGEIYSQKRNNWKGYSFSPQIFENSSIEVILSKNVYKDYLSLLNFSQYISEDGSVGVCELPFIWLGEKRTVDGSTIIEISEIVKYPVSWNLKYLTQPRDDLDYERIKKYLIQHEQNSGTILDTVPTFDYPACKNDSTTGGLSGGSAIIQFLQNETLKKYSNLVIIAGHTHPIMTNKSKNGFNMCPHGTNPEDFGLGIRGVNFSSADLNNWLSCVFSNDFDKSTHFIGANICYDGNLHLLSYENDNPKMIRNISVDKKPDIKIQTSQYNHSARENFLCYVNSNNSTCIL